MIYEEICHCLTFHLKSHLHYRTHRQNHHHCPHQEHCVVNGATLPLCCAWRDHHQRQQRYEKMGDDVRSLTCAGKWAPNEANSVDFSHMFWVQGRV